MEGDTQRRARGISRGGGGGRDTGRRVGTGTPIGGGRVRGVGRGGRGAGRGGRGVSRGG